MNKKMKQKILSLLENKSSEELKDIIADKLNMEKIGDNEYITLRPSVGINKSDLYYIVKIDDNGEIQLSYEQGFSSNKLAKQFAINGKETDEYLELKNKYVELAKKNGFTKQNQISNDFVTLIMTDDFINAISKGISSSKGYRKINFGTLEGYIKSSQAEAIKGGTIESLIKSIINSSN